MTINIILSGVGGQGILSIATVIGEAAARAGVQLKQAEVHGMSQRGGDVQSNLRLSDETIYSDLIATGDADLIISMEPMEALRYVPYLKKDGQIVTSSRPFVNIPDYPDKDAIMAELKSLPKVAMFDIEAAAQEIKCPRSANMVLLGMAAPYLRILEPEGIRAAISDVFARKGEVVVEANLKAFDKGLQNSK